MAQNFISKTSTILYSITEENSKIYQLERELWLSEVLQKHSVMSENDKNFQESQIFCVYYCCPSDKRHVKIIFLPVIALSFPHFHPKLEQTLHKHQEQHS